MAVLLITGSTGIAAATAQRALAAGDDVFTAGLEPPVDLEGDLRDEGICDQAVVLCLERYGRIDALFNCAGISGRKFGDGPLHECSNEGWDITMESNVRTMFLLSRAVLRHWMHTGAQGAIVNMSSVLASSPAPYHFASHAYAASKGAIISMTRAMAAYYAPHGIRVNAIAPGLVRTPMSARAQANDQILEYIAHKQPLSKGMLEAGDIADSALFLMSESARHITGIVLTADGGWSVTA